MPLPFSAMVSHVAGRFGDRVRSVHEAPGDPRLEFDPALLREVCGYLRDEPALRFDFLNCITVVDDLPSAAKSFKPKFEPRLRVVYHLSSVTHKHRLTLTTYLPRWADGTPGEANEGPLPRIDSVTDLWPTAIWHEREVFDLSGVEFVGHPDLRRILCPEDWIGHPLRKDYEMPLEYHGMRGR